MKILDCTLRDGGYYNSWDFDGGFVVKHLKSMIDAGIDYVELGYRSIVPGNDYFGLCKYLGDDYLETLPDTGNTKLAVMVDVKEFEQDGVALKDLVSKKFKSKAKTRLSMIRLAMIKKNFAVALELGNILKELGYEITLNLMQFMLLSDEEIKDTLKQINSSGLKIIYFADSYGSMSTGDVDRIFALASDYPDLKIGLHFHNNKDMALANTRHSLQCKPDFIDASVLGIGRGAGNLELEKFIQLLDSDKYKLEPVLQIASSEYSAMKEEYNWGPNSAYALAGSNNVHQNYVFELLSTGRYSSEEINNMIQFIAQDKRSVLYSLELLNEAIVHRFQHGSKTSFYEHSNIEKLNCDAEEILVIGRGASSKSKSSEINELIDKKDLMVFECNYIPEIIGEKNCCFSIKYNSFLENLNDLLNSKKKCVVGFPEVGRDIIKKINSKKPVYLPYQIIKNKLKCSLGEKIVIPYDVVSMYAIASAVALGVKKIYVAGFDGYKDEKDWLSQRMEAEMEEFFSLLRHDYSEVEVISVTPTTYNINKCSIYYLLENI